MLAAGRLARTGDMGRGARHLTRPPWGVDEPDRRAAGFGLGSTARSETQRLALGDTSRLDGVGRAVEPQPPQYPRIERRIEAVQDRDKTNSRFTRRNLVWYDTEHGNPSGDKVHGSRLPSLSARASGGANLATPPKPFWSDRSGSAARARQPPGSGRRAVGGGPPSELGETETVSGYAGFRPRNDVEHRDPHRYKQPPSLVERAAMTSVQRGVYGYRGFIPRDIRDKAIALPIGHQPIESRQQQFMRTTECSTPPP